MKHFPEKKKNKQNRHYLNGDMGPRGKGTKQEGDIRQVSIPWRGPWLSPSGELWRQLGSHFRKVTVVVKEDGCLCLSLVSGCPGVCRFPGTSGLSEGNGKGGPAA